MVLALSHFKRACKRGRLPFKYRMPPRPFILRTRGARSSRVGVSAFGSSYGEGFMSLNIAKPRTPTAPKGRNWGPRHHEAFSAVHLKGTPGSKLSHLGVSPIATPRRKEQLRYIPMHECRESPGPGPTVASGEFKTVRSQRDAWHQIEPSRHFAHRDFKLQG
jgi:hypothetical protein